MPVTVVARLSTDAGNTAAFGSDGGLYTPSAPPGWTIDNQWAPSGNTGYYQHAQFAAPAPVLAVANGYFYPLLFTRAGYIKDVRTHISVAGAAGSNIYLAVYAADNTGGVGTKLFDYGTIVSAATGVIGATNNTAAAAIALNAGVLYYMGYWFQSSGTLPTVSQRTGGQAPRGGAAHALSTDFTTAWACHVDSTTGGWSTRTVGVTTPVIAAAHTGANATALNVQYQIQNV